jgi:hypothetical protein
MVLLLSHIFHSVFAPIITVLIVTRVEVFIVQAAMGSSNISVSNSCHFGVVCILSIIESTLSIGPKEIVAFIHLISARVIGIAMRRAFIAIGASDALLIGGHGVCNLLLQGCRCVEM